jgi:hypothetical protein
MDLVEMFNKAAGHEGLQNLSQPVQIALLLGAFALVPAILMTMTCYTRVIIVLSFVRQGLGTQQIPPNMVLTGLANDRRDWRKGTRPLLQETNQRRRSDSQGCRIDAEVYVEANSQTRFGTVPSHGQ